MTSRISIVAVILLFVAGPLACKQKTAPSSPKPSQGVSIDKNKLCEDGGAIFVEARNACECPEGRAWDGNRCSENTPQTQCPEGQVLANGQCVESGGEDDDEKELCHAEGGTWQGDDCDCGTNKWWTGKRCLISDAEDFSWDKVRDTCEDAGGEWDRDERYCDCGSDAVLTDDECQSLTRGLTRSVCEDAVYPGSWLTGRCRCEDEDYTFSTGRGGCVPMQEDAAEDILESICESSVNEGRWDDETDRCDCPQGQLWFQETCPEQSDLSSREVCESAFNDGVWSKSEKICRCPVGTMWIDQTCRDLQNVTERTACTSDFNDGTWDETLGTCICPDDKGWIASVKRCDDDGVSAAQQLCIQSGGRPQANTGGCTCPSGMITRTLQPQNYQYCVRDDSSDDVPLWLLILLGITQ